MNPLLLLSVSALLAAPVSAFADIVEPAVIATSPANGEELAKLAAGQTITFTLTDNTDVSKISCTITSIIDSNNAEEPFGSFTTSDVNAEGQYYWTNTGSDIYLMEGRSYRFEYFVWNLDNRVASSGEFTVKGTTDPASLIAYDFNPVDTVITYYGTPEALENVVVTFTFAEDAYCDFNKFLKLQLVDSEGKVVKTQFTSKNSLREPTKYGINMTAQNILFDASYTLRVPTMFGDAEWFGVNGDKYLTGRANAPMDVTFNLSEVGVSAVPVVECDDDAVYYNLQGLPCGTDKSALAPGLYIRAGRKVHID